MNDSAYVLCIVVNFHDALSTTTCINSLKHQSHEKLFTCVVDNEHCDASNIQAFEVAGADQVIVSEENLGFAGAVNIAVSETRDFAFTHIWLLNNDAEAEHQALQALLEASIGLGAGMVASTIFYRDQPRRLWLEYAKIHEPWFIVQHIGKNQERFPRQEPFKVGFVNGCSTLIRRDVFESLGGFDTSLFLYAEDVDLCCRYRDAGGVMAMTPSSVVYHSVSASTGGEFNPLREYYITRNGYLMIRKHAKGGWPVKLFGMITRTPWDAYRFLRTGMRFGNVLEALKWFLRSVRDGVLGRSGKL